MSPPIGGVRAGYISGQQDAIPDSEDLQARYDFSQEDGITPVTDQTGNGYNLSGSYSGVNATINSTQVGEFDGTDDLLNVSWSAISEPYHVFGVVKYQTFPGFGTWFDGGSQYELALYEASGNNEYWRIFQGLTIGEGGTLNTDPHIWSAFANTSGNPDTLRIDGEEIVNTDTGSKTLSGVTLGSRADDQNRFDGFIGEVLVYPSDKTSTESSVESYLADKWGITLA